MFGIHFLWYTTLWCAVIVQIALSTATTMGSVTETNSTKSQVSVMKGYAWSAWSSWSPCSRSCGGGVSMQERKCLPRSMLGSVNGSLPRPVITVRVTRDVDDCFGVDKRYHECNTQPCKGQQSDDIVMDLRAEQCAAYDRRPFRGKFYRWIPYIDGDYPCTLNCRPLGQHFYASLALVNDGTPCTKPGARAICVQGTCQSVGSESVLASPGTNELQCGHHLVSGLFTRPRLPLGYSYVATVPRGACLLNVTEIFPSENYIALKISNGSYIMNGEFAVSLPGNYEAAGARFLYTRSGGLDQVFAYGPLLHSIDIMILYTKPNPSIMYQYYIPDNLERKDSIKPAVEAADIPIVQNRHSRRHHAFRLRPNIISKIPDVAALSKDKEEKKGSSEESVDENTINDTKYVWKITYSQCTRSCGGGFQLGRYKCVERYTDLLVSPVFCSTPAPVGRKRKCGSISCPPRWRSAAWSQCPKCGPANKTRIVGCVQDHSKGITKISDQKCPPLKPATVEKCDIPDCDDISSNEITHGDHLKSREFTDNFRQGPVYSIDVNSTDVKYNSDPSFSSAGWVYTEWSECVGSCIGGGIQTRSVRCADPSGCAPTKGPDTSMTCTPKLNCEPYEGSWFVGEWSRCSSPCGGKQIRGVLCIGGTGRHLKNSACKGPRPEHERKCTDTQDCPPMWYVGDWGKCISNCSGTPAAIQRRGVVCARGVGGAVGAGDAGGAGGAGLRDAECAPPRPLVHRACAPHCHRVHLRASSTTLHPTLVIESQKTEVQTTPGYETTTNREINYYNDVEDCEDKLQNCFLAVQARLCHYNYYVENCCKSCKSR